MKKFLASLYAAIAVAATPVTTGLEANIDVLALYDKSFFTRTLSYSSKEEEIQKTMERSFSFFENDEELRKKMGGPYNFNLVGVTSFDVNRDSCMGCGWTLDALNTFKDLHKNYWHHDSDYIVLFTSMLFSFEDSTGCDIYDGIAFGVPGKYALVSYIPFRRHSISLLASHELGHCFGGSHLKDYDGNKIPHHLMSIPIHNMNYFIHEKTAKDIANELKKHAK
jgi:hypothetical protein